MRAYGRSEFADKFARKAADSDYSKHTRLQTFSQYDIRATGEALWQHLTWRNIEHASVGLNEQAVITAMLSLRKRYDDSGDLVAEEFGDFWDACDEQSLSSATRDMIREDLVTSFLESQRKSGMSSISNLHGIWLFDKNAIWRK